MDLNQDDSERATGAGIVLVVVPERHIQRVVRSALEREGYEVRLASSGCETVRQLSEEGVDRVILDHDLGDMRGADLLAHMQSDTSIAGIRVHWLGDPFP